MTIKSINLEICQDTRVWEWRRLARRHGGRAEPGQPGPIPLSKAREQTRLGVRQGKPQLGL